MKTSRGGGAIATWQHCDCSDIIVQNFYRRMQFKIHNLKIDKAFYKED